MALHLSGTFLSSTNSDLSWLFIGVDLVIGVADEEVFAAATGPRQHIMRNDKPGSRCYYLHQYWASSLLADHADV